MLLLPSGSGPLSSRAVNIYTSLSLQQTLIKPYYLPGQQVLGAEEEGMGWNLGSNRILSPGRAIQVWN